MSALERQQQRNAGAAECIACGGSSVASNGSPCVPCNGSGSKAEVVQHSSKSNEHYTPAHIVEAAHIVLGGIDLDPASCALANDVVGAEAWYGPGSELGEDGLAEPWGGRVFLNPPGGRVPSEYNGCGTSSNAALWWARLAEEWRTGEIESAIFVGFTLEILRSAQALDVPQPIDFPFCVPKSRIAFDTTQPAVVGPKKKMGVKRVSSSQPTHANAIIYLPPKVPGTDVPGSVASFLETFTPIGKCRE